MAAFRDSYSVFWGSNHNNTREYENFKSKREAFKYAKELALNGYTDVVVDRFEDETELAEWWQFDSKGRAFQTTTNQ